ncbi:MAG: cytochrome c biogenesis protein ResB [bacterium]
MLKELGALRWTVVILIGMVIVMAYATYVESQEGHTAALKKGFHSLPMDILIAFLAINVIACTLHRAPYAPHQIPWLVTHLGLILTMVGAIVSHRTAMTGQIVLRVGSPASTATIFQGDHPVGEVPLGFHLELDSFSVKFYPGTGKAADFTSFVRMVDWEKGRNDTFTIRVNHPLVHRGWNISQASYVPGDNTVTILGANRDPGTSVSYAGFLTIFLGMVGIFFLKPWLKRKYPPAPKSQPFSARERQMSSPHSVSRE